VEAGLFSKTDTDSRNDFQVATISETPSGNHFYRRAKRTKKPNRSPSCQNEIARHKITLGVFLLAVFCLAHAVSSPPISVFRFANPGSACNATSLFSLRARLRIFSPRPSQPGQLILPGPAAPLSLQYSAPSAP